jgi:hypothetical protein
MTASIPPEQYDGRDLMPQRNVHAVAVHAAVEAAAASRSPSAHKQKPVGNAGKHDPEQHDDPRMHG